MNARSTQLYVAAFVQQSRPRYCGAPLPCILLRTSRVTQRRSASTTKRHPEPTTGSNSRRHQTTSPVTTARSKLPAKSHTESANFPKPSLDGRAVPHNIDDTVDLASTRPAFIDSPPPLEPSHYPRNRIPVVERLKHVFKIGKSYIAFYKTGFKNIWANYKQYQRIRQKIAPHALNDVAKYGGQVKNGSQLPTISRAEYQLYLRTRHDLFKLIPFSLVFLICGEFTPIIIIALGTRVVPYTCRIPKQEKQDVDKALARDQAYKDSMAKEVGHAEQHTMTWQYEWMQAYRMGLTSFRSSLPVIGQIYHNMVVQPSLQKYCNNMLTDTILIDREGGFAKLSPPEVFIWTQKYSISHLRSWVESNPAELYSPDLKNKLLPLIEQEAKAILDQDWTKLKPEEHWRTVLQSLSNLPSTRDILS